MVKIYPVFQSLVCVALQNTASYIPHNATPPSSNSPILYTLNDIINHLRPPSESHCMYKFFTG